MVRTMMARPHWKRKLLASLSSKVRVDNDQQHIHRFYICCYLVFEDVFSIFCGILKMLKKTQSLKKETIELLVIPSSAVEKKEVEAKVKVVAPVEMDIILPPDIELVSCFYKIEITRKFSKPIYKAH